MVSLGVAAPAANAAPTGKLDAELASLWSKVLETPADQNPFGAGGPESGCWRLDGVVAPFGPSGIPACTVKTGTKIFVAASSNECSTPFEHPELTTEAQLGQCAREGDAQQAPSVSIDARRVRVSESRTKLVKVELPDGNLIGAPAGARGKFVAHGWVALLNPLAPGTHTITIVNGGTTITTKIVVRPGGH
jgi:hypothetical protein